MATPPLTPIEQRIVARAREFDLGPLVRLLEAQKYPRESILFESNPEFGSSSSLVEAVTFHREPSRRVVVTLNMGLLGSNALLPSYFLEVAEQSLEPENFFDFIRFFDHRLLEGFLRALYPELDTTLIQDWEKTKGYYFRMLGVGSVATLQWLFQLYFPELRVSVTRGSLSQVNDDHALYTGSRLDGTAVLGGRYEADASGFQVELLTEEETDPRGDTWPSVVRRRLADTVLPLLKPSSIQLVVALTVVEHARWAQLDPSGYLGFDRLRATSNSGFRMVLFKGDTTSAAPSRLLPVPGKRPEAR